MILILSNQHEPTTDSVIDWLLQAKVPFFRLNSEDLFDSNQQSHIRINQDGIRIQIGDFLLDPTQIQVVWYRRWYSYGNFKVPFRQNVNNLLLKQYVTDEMDAVFNFLVRQLDHCVWLNHPFTTRLHNKLYTLQLAQQCGLRIPDTLLSNKSEAVSEFIQNNHQKAITKPIADPYIFWKGPMIYKLFTETIEPEQISAKYWRSGLSLFQQQVVRDHEIRIFYLDGQFFATAIFANNNEVDIKMSVSGGNNVLRADMVPYVLPNDVCQKLMRLMEQLGLPSGSIDMIRDAEGTHWFIEVNPVGQFLGYSMRCHYAIEKHVAAWLVRHYRAAHPVPFANETDALIA